MPTTNLFMDLIDENGKKVLGESEMGNYVGFVELDDWSWALHWEAASGDERAGIAPTTFNFSKAPDASTVSLLSHLVSGKKYNKATVHFVDFMHTRFELLVELTDFRVTSYALNGTTGQAESSMSESWEADFNKVRFKHAHHHPHTKQKINKDAEIERPRHKPLKSGTPNTPEAAYAKLLKEKKDLEEKHEALKKEKGK